MAISKTVETFVDVDVDIDLNDFDHDEIIEHLAKQGFTVVDSDIHQADEDRIYSLYRDWISLDGACFEKQLKIFFEDYTGKLVA